MESKYSENHPRSRFCRLIGIQPHSLDSELGVDLPLKHQEVNAKINNNIAVIDISQTYFNQKKNPLEIILKLPIEEDYGLGKLTVVIDGKIIEAKIMKKEKAIERYEDEVSGGHTAFMAEENKDEKDIVTLKLGNLLANQEVTIKMQFLNILKYELSSFCLRIPLSFFPLIEDSETHFSYTFLVDIKSDTNITYLSVPNKCRIVKKVTGDALLNVLIEKEEQKGCQLQMDLVFYYRNLGVEQPMLIAQQSESHQDEIACIMSFVPTFLKSSAITQFETTEEEKPEAIEAPEVCKEKSMYVFIVDRSGSMGGESMEITKQALILFIKSLPIDSYFDVISFGSIHTLMSQDILNDKMHWSGFEYNDANVNLAIDTIKYFEADYGGTNMGPALESAANNLKMQKDMTMKIFLLTDGEDGNPKQVAQIAKQASKNSNIRVHTFGIGTGVNQQFIMEVAQNGKGTFNLVPDTKNLRRQVINALSISQEPQYSNCSMIQQITNIYDLFTEIPS